MNANKILVNLGACQSARDWARRQRQSPETLWNRCPRADWLLWILECTDLVSCQTVTKITLEIAESVLHLVPKDNPHAAEALRVVRAWLRREATLDEVRRARDAARAAARDAGHLADDARVSAAWSAVDAAESALYGNLDALGNAIANASHATRELAQGFQERKYADIVRKHVPFHQVAKFLQTVS